MTTPSEEQSAPLSATLPFQMFERASDLSIIRSSVAMSHSNLSVVFSELRNVTYAAVSDVSQVSIVELDSKMETNNWNSIAITYNKVDKPAQITQACLVLPTSRSIPLLVVCTDQGVQIYDVKGSKQLASALITLSELFEASDAWFMGCRGITCSDCLILIGSWTGEILQFLCNGETSVSQKKPVKEHNHPILDLATCKYDEVTCSVDTTGLIIVWQKPMRGPQHKIQTGHSITVINVLRKQCICGTTTGTVFLYSIITADLMSRIEAHARPITAISVAPESAYMMTAGQDGRFVIFKLHTRKPSAYQVEYRYSDEVDAGMIAGCQFITGRGSGIAVACYDTNVLNIYKIVKRPAPTKAST